MRLYTSLTAGQVDLYAPRGTWACVKRLLLLATLLAVVLPGPANAAGSPCRNKIFDDWYPDGKIASTYPVACYRDALKHIAEAAQRAQEASLEAFRASIRAVEEMSEGKTPVRPGR